MSSSWYEKFWASVQMSGWTTSVQAVLIDCSRWQILVKLWCRRLFLFSFVVSTESSRRRPATVTDQGADVCQVERAMVLLSDLQQNRPANKTERDQNSKQSPRCRTPSWNFSASSRTWRRTGRREWSAACAGRSTPIFRRWSRPARCSCDRQCWCSHSRRSAYTMTQEKKPATKLRIRTRRRTEKSAAGHPCCFL